MSQEQSARSKQMGLDMSPQMAHTERLAATFAPMIALVITVKNIVEALSSFSHLPHGLMGFVLETLKGNLLLTHPYFSDR